MWTQPLFNIVEAQKKKKRLLNFDVCVVWWFSDGSINSQEYKRFEIHVVTIKISMTDYHHSINCFLVYANTAVYGGGGGGDDEYGQSGHLSIFTSLYLKTLFIIVEAPFKRLLNFDVCVVWWC